MHLDAALDILAKDPSTPLDLAELALLLARDEYPNLDVEACLSELNGMAHEARAHMGGDLPAQVTGLCRYLFHDMGFRGNTQDYYDPRNSYLNEVLDRRTGIPLTLSVVAMVVGQRAGLEIVGVGLPGHFVVKAVRPGRAVLFDPFHGGRQLTPDHCEQLVRHVTGLTFQAIPANLQATPLGQIVQRLLNNLKAVYLRRHDYRRGVRVIERLHRLNPGDAVQRRDLGVCLVQLDRAGPAIDHLSAYLTALPQAEDVATVRQVLERARSTVAQWN